MRQAQADARKIQGRGARERGEVNSLVRSFAPFVIAA
jgi:hypothetical protein